VGDDDRRKNRGGILFKHGKRSFGGRARLQRGPLSAEAYTEHDVPLYFKQMSGQMLMGGAIGGLFGGGRRWRGK
jgi:hypothetical protein